MALQIDQGKMFCAVSKATGFLEVNSDERGFLNVNTGEVAFIFVKGTVQSAAMRYGEDAGDDEYRHLVAIAENPNDWVEIPKFDGPLKADPMPFIREFLRSNNIEADLV